MSISTISLDTCVISNLARYRDIIINGENSIYYGKFSQNEMDEYEKLYKVLKN